MNTTKKNRAKVSWRWRRVIYWFSLLALGCAITPLPLWHWFISLLAVATVMTIERLEGQDEGSERERERIRQLAHEKWGAVVKEP